MRSMRNIRQCHAVFNVSDRCLKAFRFVTLCNAIYLCLPSYGMLTLTCTPDRMMQFSAKQRISHFCKYTVEYTHLGLTILFRIHTFSYAKASVHYLTRCMLLYPSIEGAAGRG